MAPKDLFQTSLRIAGVILLFYTLPRAVADLITLFAVGGQPFIVGTIIRILWEIIVPIWMICGAKALTRAIYGTA